MTLAVILCTHNPERGRLGRTLDGLRAQTLPPGDWETVIIDNASTPPVESPPTPDRSIRVVVEPHLGLSSARRRGLAETRADLVVFVDDDNVLAPDYLARVRELFAAHPKVGALGGKSRPEFATTPPAWTREFQPLLALRDLGDAPLISRGLRSGDGRNSYPAFAPIGAGLALRRHAAQAWLDSWSAAGAPSDRRGTELSSAGDNDIVLCVMKAGWEVAYFPELELVHLIPDARLEPGYLERLNRGIQKSWMQVLSRHDANPWPALSASGARLRQLRAWFSYRAWSSPAARIRWAGACGHFEGRVLR